MASESGCANHAPLDDIVPAKQSSAAPSRAPPATGAQKQQTMPDDAPPGGKSQRSAIQRAHVWARAAAAEPTRLYRDAHRVFKAMPFASYVREVRLRLHGRPAGPADGSGWDVCSYSTRAGDMGESQGYLVEAWRAIRVTRVLGEEQGARAPLYLEAGQYVGVQNTSGELCTGGGPAGGRGPGRGACPWTTKASTASTSGFEGAWLRAGLAGAAAQDRGRLKERHVGFCAMLREAAAAPRPRPRAPVQAHVVEAPAPVTRNNCCTSPVLPYSDSDSDAEATARMAETPPLTG